MRRFRKVRTLGMGSRLVLGLALWIAPKIDAAIDFSPVEIESRSEGFITRVLSFRSDHGSINYRLPEGWTYSGGGRSLTLIPPQVGQVQLEMQQAPLAGPQAFDEEQTQKALEAQVLGSVVQGAQNLALVSVETNPIKIQDRETFAVTVSYTFYGRGYLLNVLFVNLTDTQLRFRCLATKEDFPSLLRLFRGSLCTFAWAQ